MKIITYYFSVFICLFTLSSIAQITSIPDPNFEQALVDLNIDSDGIVNGQVLTADIENIVELDFTGLFPEQITDFTGIQDFVALEVLNLYTATVVLSEDQADVFNSNINLREFHANTQSFDVGPFVLIPYLDFSNLNNLDHISLVNSGEINTINLANLNTTYQNLTIDLSHEYWDPPNTYTVCINVSDAQAALANQFPYNTWHIITPQPDQNGYVWRDYSFSDNCNLSVNDFDELNVISVFPNPVKDKLNFVNSQNIKIEQIDVHDISGKSILHFIDIEEQLDISHLEAGVYFVSLKSGSQTKTIKIVKQ